LLTVFIFFIFLVMLSNRVVYGNWTFFLLNVFFRLVKSLIKQFYQTQPIIIYLWRFNLYPSSLSEEVYSILLPVLATVELWRGKKSVVRVAECVIHRLLTLFTNIYCFFDLSCVSVRFSVQNYRSLPVDHMAVVRCMVSQSWFVLFWQTWCSLTSGGSVSISHGLHFRLTLWFYCNRNLMFSPHLCHPFWYTFHIRHNN